MNCRLLITIFIFLASNNSLFAQSNPIMLKTEKDYSFKNPGNHIIKRKINTGSSYYYYDQQGRIVSKTVEGVYWFYYNSVLDSSIMFGQTFDKKHFTKSDYFYDENRLINHKLWQCSHDSSDKYLIYNEEYEYDSLGIPLYKIRLEPNGEVWNFWHYVDYNSYSRYNGLTGFIRYKSLSENPRDRGGFYIINDSLGRPLEEIDFFDDTIVSVIRHVYTIFDSEICYTYFGSHEDINSLNEITQSFYHPEDSRILKRITLNPGRNYIQTDEYKYNRKMQLIKIKHFIDNKLTEITKYKYKSLESK